MKDPEKLERKKLNSDRSVCTASLFDSGHCYFFNTELRRSNVEIITHESFVIAH